MMQSLVDKTVKTIKAIPKWGWLVGPGCVAVNEALYLSGPLIAKAIGTAEHAIDPSIPAIDGIIPLIPAFILIYVYSYAFWIIGLIVVSLTEKKNLVNTLIAMFGCFFTAFLIYIFLPTKQDRVALGLIDAASRPGIFNRLLLFIYNSDGGDIATNMLPSQHVMYSVFTWLGVCRQPMISKGFRIYSFIVMSLIILATLFTRQHFILDVISAIILSIFWYILIRIIDPYGRITGNR